MVRMKVKKGAVMRLVTEKVKPQKKVEKNPNAHKRFVALKTSDMSTFGYQAKDKTTGSTKVCLINQGIWHSEEEWNEKKTFQPDESIYSKSWNPKKSIK